MSTTRVKDAATTLWRQHSPSYDNNRAVHIPSTEPGQTVRRSRQSSETEYQYRKRQAVTSKSTNEESSQIIDEDEAVVTAMSIHRSLKFAMSLEKKDVLEKSKKRKIWSNYFKNTVH
jgi:hypothetical protein